MSSHGTIAALAALALTACADPAPPAAVSQGAVSLTMAEPETLPGAPELHNADVGDDALRSRIAD